MVVFDTVDLIFRVNCEGYAIKTLVTDYTTETAWVVRLPQGLQDLYGENQSQTYIIIFG